MGDSATTGRPPLTSVPQIDRIGAGRLREVAGYRVIRTHGSPDHLIMVTVSGHGQIITTSGTTRTSVGDVVMFEPHVPQDYGIDPGHHEWTLLFSHVHPRADWAPMLDWPEIAPGVHLLRLTGEAREQVVKNLAQMAQWARSGHPRAELLALNALELALVWCDGANPQSRLLDPRIARALNHLDTHLTQAHTVASLAAVAHLSASRFTHLFTAQVGVAPMAYWEQQRMAQARMYLEMTNHSIAEIARLVGFADPLYFSARFRKLVGRSPREHRVRGRKLT